MSSIRLIPRTGRIEKAERQIITARDTEATYFDKNGILQTAAPNEIRYSKNFETGKQEILLEDERTNYIGYTEITSEHYSKKDIEITPVSSETVFSAAELKKLGQSGNDRLLYYLSLQQGIYTSSIFVKNISVTGATTFGIYFSHENGGFTVARAKIVWDGLAITQMGTSFPAYSDSVLTYGYHAIANNWYRIWVTQDLSDLDVQDTHYLSIDIDRVDLQHVSKIRVSQPQIEPSTTPTTPIQTNGQPATRAADKLVFAT